MPLLSLLASAGEGSYTSTAAMAIDSSLGRRRGRTIQAADDEESEGLKWGGQLVMTELRLEGKDGGGAGWFLPEHGGMMEQEEGTGIG